VYLFFSLRPSFAAQLMEKLLMGVFSCFEKSLELGGDREALLCSDHCKK